jgi:hypothetical protein
MRNAMQGVLPTKIQWRHGKANLNPGWARAWGFARNSRMEEVLTNPTPAMGHYLDMSRVRELHDRYLKGETVGEEGKSLWRALSLALWLSAREVQ